MPIFGTKSSKKGNRGNLFIQFEVEFPKKVPKEIAEKLTEILPGKSEVKKEKEEKENVDIEEVSLSDPNFENYETGDRNEAYLSDEEEHGGNGGGSGCHTQ